MPQPTLSETQSWLLTVMTAAGGTGKGVALAHDQYGWQAQELVAHPQPAARLAIYADGYVMRLLECLRADFPVLHRVMGAPLFTFFSKAYIWQCPSRSTSLYELGAGFADFLRHSQPARQTPDSAQEEDEEDALLRLPFELATLERARAEAMRAPGLEKRKPPAQDDAIELLLGQDVQIAAAPCLRLLALRFPLLAFWEQANTEQETPPLPVASPSFIAVTRLRYRVSMCTLAAWQFHFLEAARHQPSSHQCARHAAERSGFAMERILAELLVWLPVAAQNGLIEWVRDEKQRG